MPILKPRPPADVAEAFSSQLAEFVWAEPGQERLKQQFVGEMGEIPSLSDLGHPGERSLLHDAHRLFILGLQDIADNAGIDAAKFAGWRFFAGKARGKILLGTVAPKADGWRLTAGYYGKRVGAALIASLALDKLKELQGGKYELRVLAVLGLNLEAFWLASVDEERPDLVVPFPAKPDQPIEALNKRRVYTMANFLAAIRPLAQLRLAADWKYGG